MYDDTLRHTIAHSGSLIKRPTKESIVSLPAFSDFHESVRSLQLLPHLSCLLSLRRDSVPIRGKHLGYFAYNIWRPDSRQS